ncbi:hypothetical protein H5410_008567 [Solanum commersonii]|uniref:Uncharacterized protein n=1 Tax=Solanum commersonii TaxID=4109 RepID=A0A9J6AFB7_SOLCO|nr:hypothetical protein H5410_008567 [Solanum commersonii]
MSGDVGRKIGQALGGTIDVVIPGNGGKEGRYTRLKVMMNISKPLPRGKLIKLRGDTTWVELRYENLPCVCFYCDTLKNDQFGAWLKAENRVASADYQRHKGEDKCSKLPLDKNTYDAITNENEDAAQMNTKDLTENINQGIIIANQIGGHKGINTIQAGTKYQMRGLQNDDGGESIGIVALDSLGNTFHAHGSPIQFVRKVMIDKAIAIGKALEYAISKG